ncbi:hypothetical protein HON01_06470 [Candidatus Woesearchaeota archaeon]|nr:hypothetical protein [Candidatus Woesearchaeota archaeon]MBT7367278.1 hypothetical protein [Candidatus Woesearchaeota archaeon]
MGLVNLLKKVVGLDNWDFNNAVGLKLSFCEVGPLNSSLEFVFNEFELVEQEYKNQLKLEWGENWTALYNNIRREHKILRVFDNSLNKEDGVAKYLGFVNYKSLGGVTELGVFLRESEREKKYGRRVMNLLENRFAVLGNHKLQVRTAEVCGIQEYLEMQGFEKVNLENQYFYKDLFIYSKYIGQAFILEDQEKRADSLNTKIFNPIRLLEDYEVKDYICSIDSLNNTLDEVGKNGC